MKSGAKVGKQRSLRIPGTQGTNSLQLITDLAVLIVGPDFIPSPLNFARRIRFRRTKSTLRADVMVGYRNKSHCPSAIYRNRVAKFTSQVPAESADTKTLKNG